MRTCVHACMHYVFYSCMHVCIYASMHFIFLVMKKIKHKVVETMSSGTADALGLSRAILCNGEHEKHFHFCLLNNQNI